MDDSSSSSDEENEILAVVSAVSAASLSQRTPATWSGSKTGRRNNVDWGKCSWWKNYLDLDPVYPACQFRKPFRIPLKLFRKLHHDLVGVEPMLQQKVDAVRRVGASSWQKILVALRRLADRTSFESLDDQSRMSAESQRQFFMPFLKTMRRCYGPEFLNRRPMYAELKALEREYAGKLFPECIGSIDCMNVSWKNCPKAWKGQCRNPKNGKHAMISVEAMCDADLYCWHVYLGRPRTNNDITVAESSPLILYILSGNRRMKLPEGYVVNVIRRHWYLYYLADGIYPDSAIFVKPNHAPVSLKERCMSKPQEGRRREVERLFGVLQGRFRILRNEFR